MCTSSFSHRRKYFPNRETSVWVYLLTIAASDGISRTKILSFSRSKTPSPRNRNRKTLLTLMPLFLFRRSRRSLHRVRRIQILRQKPVNLRPRLFGQLRVNAVKRVSARRVLVNLVFELLARRFQRLDQALDLEHVHVFIVGVGVDEQRRLQLLGIPGGRATFVLIDVLFGSLAQVIRGGIEIAIALALV